MYIVIFYAVLYGQCYGGVQQKVRGTHYLLEASKVWRPFGDTEERLIKDGMVPEKTTAKSRTVPEKGMQTDGILPEKSTVTNGTVQDNSMQTDGMVPESYTENYKLTRHKSRKRLKKKFMQNCMDAYPAECDELSRQLVNAHNGIKKKSKSNLLKKDIKINFRFCLNGLDIVHYDPKTQICCDGVFNKTSGSEECCSGKIIDNTLQFCCNGQIQNRTESSECCGIYTFDQRKETCCNGNLFPNLDGSRCCGDNVYDEDYQICCFDTYTFRLSQGDSCCGTGVYNSSTHTCCETNVQPVHGRYNSKGECCKDQSYHTKCFKCENDEIIPLFNESKEICCEGKNRPRKYGYYTGCCRRQVMHTGTHQCLNNKHIIHMSTATHNLSTGDDVVSVTLRNDERSEIRSSSREKGLVIVSVGVLITVVNGGVVIFCLCRKRRSKKPEIPLSKGASCFDQAHTKLSSEEEPIANVSQPLKNNNCFPEQNNQDDDCLVNIQNCSSEKQKPRDNTDLQLISDAGNGISFILKPDKIPNENLLTNHYKNSYTQTCPQKESNRRTVFGKPFDHHFILGMSNGTAKMPNSDVKMTLPQSFLRQNQVEVNCTSFGMVSPLRRKFGLSEDETIASPAVEYALTGNSDLPDYAVVVIPFIGSPADLKVRKFQSDEGLNLVVQSVDVPLQGKTNEDVDAFHIIKDSEVYIYTKSFSGFFCTTCRHRPLNLRCFLFGSYKRFTNPLRHEVRVMIYLADDLMKYADYKERMFRNEQAQGRVLKKEMQLRLPSELTEVDLIKASVTPTESHYLQWIHKLYPGETTPIYDEIQTLQLESVAEKCRNCDFCHLPEHDIPQCIEWYMTNADGVIPNYTFQCIVDVDIIRTTDDTKTSNRIVIDELQLRQEDRYPIEEQFNARSVKGLKEYLSGAMPNDKRDAVLGSLISKYSCTGTSVEEVFFKIQEKLTPKYLLEAVATVMREKHMFTELDVLQANGFLPQTFILTDVQAVNEDVPDGEGRADRPNYVTVQRFDLNEDNSNEVESKEILNGVECINTGAAVLVRSDDYPLGTEYLNLVTNISANAQMEPRHVRPELSHTRHVTSISRSLGELTLTREPDVFAVRGEITTPAVYSKSTKDSQTLHAQECASLDETHLKKTFKKTKSQD